MFEQKSSYCKSEEHKTKKRISSVVKELSNNKPSFLLYLVSLWLFRMCVCLRIRKPVQRKLNSNALCVRVWEVSIQTMCEIWVSRRSVPRVFLRRLTSNYMQFAFTLISFVKCVSWHLRRCWKSGFEIEIEYNEHNNKCEKFCRNWPFCPREIDSRL